MSDKIRDIIEEIESLKIKLKDEIASKEEQISFEIKNGHVKFERNIALKQQEVMKNLSTYFKEIPFLHLLSSPIVYAMIIPAIFLDITLFLYQQTIFRIYKFKFVKRSDYIILDRQYLGYLNLIEKINCMYCSYFNGLMYFAAEIATKSELYFCPIKHAKKVVYKHSYYDDYLSYGDEKDFQEKLEAVRKKSQEI